MNHDGLRIITVLAALVLAAMPLRAEPDYVPAAGDDAAAVTSADAPAFSQAELDQMLAPIALYPDPLLAQILIASTYPLEIVEAARWSSRNPQLAGEDAVAAVADRDWDPSVKALVAFPDVLARMDEDLDWTRNLGDAMLFQEAQVMDSVQFLRARADAAGSLEQDKHVRVIREQETIIIEPVETRLVHVPYYDTRVVYGPWWRPAYPPLYWGPPSYYYPTYTGFYWSAGIHLSPGFFFSSFYWPHSTVVILNRPHYHYYPRHYHAPRYRAPHRSYYVPGERWTHNPAHRRGARYRHAEVRQRYQPYIPAPSARRAAAAGNGATRVRPAPEARQAPGMPAIGADNRQRNPRPAVRATEPRLQQQIARLPREHRRDLPRDSRNREASRQERQLSAGTQGRKERSTVNRPASRNVPAAVPGAPRRAVQPTPAGATPRASQPERSARASRPAQTRSVAPAPVQRQSRAAPRRVPDAGRETRSRSPRGNNHRDARESMR